MGKKIGEQQLRPLDTPLTKVYYQSKAIFLQQRALNLNKYEMRFSISISLALSLTLPSTLCAESALQDIADKAIAKQEIKLEEKNTRPLSHQNKHPLINTSLDPQQVSISQLENLVAAQNQTIDRLIETINSNPRNKPPSEKPMSFEMWSGILLAVAALVLGAVGIGLAIFSFIGYKELINKGVEKAKSVATEISEKVAEKTISEQVEIEVSSQIERLIIDGTFDNVVTERVEQYIYRGIGKLPNNSGTKSHSKIEEDSEDDE